MGLVDLRLDRMARLAEVGEAGCARIAASEIEIGGVGLEGEIEEHYLLAAGVVRVRRGTCEERAPFEVGDEAARAVAMGAYRALVSLRRVIGMAL
jgi:hypothetical protein